MPLTTLTTKTLLIVTQVATVLISTLGQAEPHKSTSLSSAQSWGRFKLSSFKSKEVIEDVIEGKSHHLIKYKTLDLWGVVILDENTGVYLLPHFQQSGGKYIVIGGTSDPSAVATCSFIQTNSFNLKHFEEFNVKWFTDPVLFPKYQRFNKNHQPIVELGVKLRAGSLLSIEKTVLYGDGITGEFVLSHKSDLGYSVICRMNDPQNRKFLSLTLNELSGLFGLFKLEIHNYEIRARQAPPPVKEFVTPPLGVPTETLADTQKSVTSKRRIQLEAKLWPPITQKPIELKFEDAPVPDIYKIPLSEGNNLSLWQEQFIPSLVQAPEIQTLPQSPEIIVPDEKIIEQNQED